jgi:hypothetical protein
VAYTRRWRCEPTGMEGTFGAFALSPREVETRCLDLPADKPMRDAAGSSGRLVSAARSAGVEAARYPVLANKDASASRVGRHTPAEGALVPESENPRPSGRGVVKLVTVWRVGRPLRDGGGGARLGGGRSFRSGGGRAGVAAKMVAGVMRRWTVAFARGRRRHEALGGDGWRERSAETAGYRRGWTGLDGGYGGDGA